MSIYKIVDSTARPEFLPELRSYFNSVWGEGNPYAIGPTGRENPPTLFVLINDELVGGLVFTWIESSTDSCIDLWLNGVYVVEKFRKKGIASKLINEAYLRASNLGETRIFAFSDLKKTNLYTSNEWQSYKQKGSQGIFVREL